MASEISFPEADTAVASLEAQIAAVVELLSGRAGGIAAEIIGEGQTDRHVLAVFRERFFGPLRAAARDVIDRGKQEREIDPAIDTELAIDMIYGPIYYRLLVGHQPLDAVFARDLSRHVVLALQGSSIDP